MKTKVGLSHEPRRKLPWLVYWFGEPDSETGKQTRRSKCFRYNREARVFQAAKQNEFDRGGPRERPEDVTLGRLLDEFWEARVAALSYPSQVCYRNTMNQVREFFGNHLPVTRIKQRNAETFMATRGRRDGRSGDLSTYSMAQHLKLSRAIFNAAVEWDYIGRNPFQLKRTGRNSSLCAKPRSKPWHHLTPNEFSLMMEVVPCVRRRAAYWLMYGSGLRPGEAYNVMLQQIDLASRRIHIRNRPGTLDAPPFTVKADGQADESKERTLPVPDSAMPDLTAACAQAFKSGGFVVLKPERFATVQRYWRACREHQPWGGHEWRPWQNRDMLNNLLRDTKAYLSKAGVELAGAFDLKTFRKSFGQNHAEAGTPPKTLASLLGHSDVSVTMEFYNQTTDANEQAAAQTMNRLLGPMKERAVGTS